MSKRYTPQDRMLRKMARGLRVDWRKVKSGGKRGIDHRKAIAWNAEFKDALSAWAKEQMGKTFQQLVDEQNAIARSQMLAAYRRIKEGKETT